MFEYDNLIALDMDGVVNSRKLISLWIGDKYKELSEGSYSLVGEELRLAVRKAYMEEFVNMRELVFQELAERITEICNQCDAYILWTSTWRKLPEYKDIKVAQDMFNRKWLPGDKLIDYTPSFSLRDDGYRGNEIKHWLSDNKIGKCAVIDDRWDAGVNLPSNAKFFQINDDIGITEENKNEIISYFNS